MSDEASPVKVNPDTVKVTINGREIETAPGRLLIDVAEEQDIFVPRFCYHPGLDSVAACRMCLVQIEGSRRPLEPACVTRVADGMVVHTNSPIAKDAQEGVLELLLINHPLDCPICDRGGECPLQDQSLRFGPGKSRYQEEKRHYKKPIPISDLVMLDRERCVLCWRCVRFSEEVAGDPFIDLLDRGSLTQINTAEDSPFDSYFSGNTIQICPVGALTGSTYRFLSRPWDLKQAQS
ncbi:MAG: 2Fe-2S iron-sulfur cluster-binding protein, partial [Acidimicrobiia bacterium]